MNDIRSLFNFLINDKEVRKISEDLPFSADSIEGLALGVATSFLNDNKNIAVVLPSLFDAQTFIDFVLNFVNKDDVLFYPYDEVLRIEAISSSKEMLKERIFALYETCNKDKKHIFVTHAISLIHDVSLKEKFISKIKKIKVGDVIERTDLVNYLLSLGYTKTNKIESVFQYAQRGEIIDIYSPSNEDPYRLEFFDNEIEEIREFNVATEMSYRSIREMNVVPCVDNIFEKDEIKSGIERIKKELSHISNAQSIEKEELVNRTNNFITMLEVDSIDETEARYLPYFISKHNSVLNYLGEYTVYMYLPNDISYAAESYYREAKQYFNELRNGNLALPSEMSCFSFDEIKYEAKLISVINDDSSLSVADIPYQYVNVNFSPRMIDELKNEGYEVTTILSENKYENFYSLCKDQHKIVSLSGEGGDYNVVISNDLSHGFLLKDYKKIFLSSKEIFGAPQGNSYFLKRFKEAKVLNKYQDLAYGDYVVHEEQGIGKYVGIQEISGLEYLKIMYAGEGQFLYVPISKYKLIRKYSGHEGVAPRIDTLGGSSWARRKAKIRGRVSYLADKLIEISAIRASTPGFAFQEDDEFEESFAKAFPYELTIAQQKAVNEIKKDMEAPHPMDRLLAGDVGFGKTEVAFRAAYKAILSGKQVALLCPTTVLAKQHYEVALKRFEGFGVNICVLSRNVSKKDQATIIEKIGKGKYHLIIGTHRILSKDIVFNDLGLLIVDEEQRFGVTHKEKIKELTTNIDVLTLTATPIPRTLQMSLLNVRSLSLLNDPPFNRLPIKTYIVKHDKNLVREVISRELGRKGQVYYLHNRISSIYRTADNLSAMFPSAKVSVVHGQMDPSDMSEIMSDFYEGKVDILVCTTIIETGLDVSNCNTIIVESAQNFGLAQLYQIKGRVGRSSRLAYAYLTYTDLLALNEDSRKRLKALKDFTELGSGYKIATQDLNIRGAGDILGKEQAGFIDSLGYEAYMNLLKEVMKEKTVQDKAKEEKIGTRFELSFSLDSHIPSTYASEADRINIYRDLFDISLMSDLEKYRNKIEDVYGKFDEEMQNLFFKKQIEIELSSKYVDKFEELIDRYVITMHGDYSRIPHIGLLLHDSLEKYDKKIYSRFGKGVFSFTLYKTAEYLEDLFDVIETLLSFTKETN